MSKRPPRRGRCSQATKRGQAVSVSTVNSGCRGHGASSAGGCGACLSFFSAAGRVIESEHAEVLVEWITKPSSFSSSSVTQAQSSLPSNAAAKVAYSIGSLFTESPELFYQSVGYLLLEDAQQFKGSNDGLQVEEGSNVSLERGGATEGQETDSHVPPAATYFAPVMRREWMMRSLTVPGCLREERRKVRRRHNSNKAGCPLGGSLRAATLLHHTTELRRCRVLLTPRDF
ncbi:hypothetical protein AB205_0105890, partial [Aquarana catesbeiana]